jgi:hypothetical protein
MGIIRYLLIILVEGTHPCPEGSVVGVAETSEPGDPTQKLGRVPKMAAQNLVRAAETVAQKLGNPEDEELSPATQNVIAKKPSLARDTTFLERGHRWRLKPKVVSADRSSAEVEPKLRWESEINDSEDFGRGRLRTLGCRGLGVVRLRR